MNIQEFTREALRLARRYQGLLEKAPLLPGDFRQVLRKTSIDGILDTMITAAVDTQQLPGDAEELIVGADEILSRLESAAGMAITMRRMGYAESVVWAARERIKPILGFLDGLLTPLGRDLVLRMAGNALYRMIKRPT